MPHLIVEYSANLENDVDIDALLGALHAAAIKTGVFPLGGCRTRAARRDHYVISNDAPENAFVHLIARIGAGRSVETKKGRGQPDLRDADRPAVRGLRAKTDRDLLRDRRDRCGVHLEEEQPPRGA